MTTPPTEDFDYDRFTDARACSGGRVRHLISNDELVGNESSLVDAVALCGAVSQTGYALGPTWPDTLCRRCQAKARPADV